MSDAAPTAYLRPNPRDLREIPLDTDSALRARSALTAPQLGVWFALRTHLWLYGSLPATPRALAAIGGVTPRTIEKMMPALDPLFDRDDTGRWRDLDLEDERDRRLDLEPGQAIARTEAFAPRAVDKSLSEIRRQAGKKGGESRWRERRQRLTLVSDRGAAGADDAERAAAAGHDAGLGADNLAASSLPLGMANAIANGMAKQASGDGSASVDLPRFLPSGASRAPGPSDGLSSLESKEKTEESDGRTDGGAPGATPAASFEPSDGKPDGKPAAHGGVTDPLAMAKSPRELMASVASGAMANGMAKGMANAPAALPYTFGEALGDGAATPPGGLSDAAIIEALQKAGGDRISPTLLTPAGIAPVRAWLAAGADLHRHVMPAVTDCVRGLTEPPLRSLQAKFLGQAVLSHQKHDRRGQAPLADVYAGMAFVVVDSPQWAAWCAHKRRRTMFSFEREGDRRRGAWLESEWPPGCDRSAFLTNTNDSIRTNLSMMAEETR